MLALVLLLTATPATVSHDGRFRFTISEHGDNAVVLVRAAGPKGPVVGRLSIHGNNPEARFVAGDNLLVTWSCGSPCENAALITPQGTSLASLTFPVVSADGRFALDLDVLNLDPGDVTVSAVDLRSGKRTPAEHYPGLFQCTESTASATEVVFSGCDGDRVTHVLFALGPSVAPVRRSKPRR